MTEKYHRAFGCYGIIGNSNELVVIKKTPGHTLIAMIYLEEV